MSSIEKGLGIYINYYRRHFYMTGIIIINII